MERNNTKYIWSKHKEGLTLGMFVTEGWCSHVTESQGAFAAAVDKEIAVMGMKLRGCNYFCQVLHIGWLYIYNVWMEVSLRKIEMFASDSYSLLERSRVTRKASINLILLDKDVLDGGICLPCLDRTQCHGIYHIEYIQYICIQYQPVLDNTFTADVVSSQHLPMLCTYGHQRNSISDLEFPPSIN